MFHKCTTHPNWLGHKDYSPFWKLKNKLIENRKWKKCIIRLKIHFPSPIYILLFSCTNATFLLWYASPSQVPQPTLRSVVSTFKSVGESDYASPTSLRQSHGCQCKCTSGAQVHRGGANFAPPLCNSTASDAFTRSSSWRLWNLVQPPWLAAGICWNFSFTKSRLILASTDQHATASLLFNHRCNAATNFLSLTCIHNAQKQQLAGEIWERPQPDVLFKFAVHRSFVLHSRCWRFSRSWAL